MKKQPRSRIWDAITSLKLSIVCLAALMVLVVACTLAQVELGTLGAVNKYIRSMFIWWTVPGTHVALPVLPGGALIGLILGINLVAAQIKRLEFSKRKAGLWLIHAGLILLVAGEFVTSAMQVDAQMAIEVGQTVNYVESPRDFELAITDVTDPRADDVYGVPSRLLAQGGDIEIPETPLTLRVERYFVNANLAKRGPTDAPPLATMGVGPSVSVSEQPPATGENQVDHPAVVLEVLGGPTSYGKWLVSNDLEARQSFTHLGRTYNLEMRSRRYYLPYSVTLKHFAHDVYPGTDIPKNFSSLVHVSNPSRAEERDVLIYMNQPLRYEGKAFYQASFGKGDMLSILQVVDNPGWLIPYIACLLVGLGLLLHFGIVLRKSLARRPATGVMT